jgi:hypothetical protein
MRGEWWDIEESGDAPIVVHSDMDQGLKDVQNAAGYSGITKLLV